MLHDILNLVLLSSTLRIATPLILASLGGVVAERSGVTNIGLEGMMLLGAFLAVVGSFYAGPWVGVACALGGGMLAGLIHGFMSITVKANQIISGTAINILAVGLPNILIPVIWPEHFATTPVVETLPCIQLDAIGKLPVVGPILNAQSPIMYVAFLMVPFLHVMLYKTRFGLRLRALGEHPKAADTLGVHVVRIRYIAMLISGSLAGLGGAFLSIAYQSQFSMAMTAGRGFIGMAAMIFGRWKPVGALVACLLFGFADAFQAAAQSAGVPIPPDLFLAFPYVLTLIALVSLAGKRSGGPAAAGKPYIAA